MPLTRVSASAASKAWATKGGAAYGQINDEEIIKLLMEEVKIILGKDSILNASEFIDFFKEKLANKKGPASTKIDVRNDTNSTKTGIRYHTEGDIKGFAFDSDVQNLRIVGTKKLISPTKLKNIDNSRRLSGIDGDFRVFAPDNSSHYAAAQRAEGPFPLVDVPPPPDTYQKQATSIVDREILKTWKGVYRKDFRSQNQIMNNHSAASYVESYPIINTKILKHDKSPLRRWDWEWLHLIAFSMGGNQADVNPQQPTNLVAGTYACNTWMLYLEEGIKRLINKYKIQIEITVIAELIPATHIANRITYHVTIINPKDANDKSKNRDYIFNPLGQNDPLKQTGTGIDQDLNNLYSGHYVYS